MLRTLKVATRLDVIRSENDTRWRTIVCVDCFNYLGSFLTKDGNMILEVRTRISKAQAAHIGLKYLWHRPHTALMCKSHVDCAAVRRCLYSTIRTGWSDPESIVRISYLALGKDSENFLPQRIKLGRLRWLSHMSIIPCTIFRSSLGVERVIWRLTDFAAQWKMYSEFR